MGKSKLSPPSGSAALRQLDSIYKKALLYIYIERESFWGTTKKGQNKNLN